eukprot:XP_797290.3 PREDICTED: kremen protein 2 [Strongylocentrotus purpuratus]
MTRQSMYDQRPDYRILFTVCIIAANVIVTPTLAQFKTPRAARFDSNALWKGTPEVRFNNNNNWVVICADSRWNIEVARAVCYHRGFGGVMLMDTNTLNSPVNHASCVPDYSSTPPLTCQEISTTSCSEVQRISCFLPGYQGCYRNTNSNPYFSITPPQPFDQTLQDCARDCYSQGYEFAGVSGQRCSCDNSNEPAEGEELGPAACQTACQGDSDQVCGGNNAISVYDASLGQCGLKRVIEDGDSGYLTSKGFPSKYLPDSNCQHELIVNLASSYLEIYINYLLGDNDVLELYFDSDNITLRGGSGLESAYIWYPEFGSIVSVDFQAQTPTTGGYFIIYFNAELNETTDYSSSSSSSYDTPPPSPPSESTTTTASPPSNNNIALYIGVGVAAAVVIILFIALLSVFITARRNRSKPAAGGHVDVNSATNVAYNMDNERVKANIGNTPGTHSTDEDTHRYATIEGDYYYAPTNGPQPPLPHARDGAAPANQEAQYEELPGDTAGTPYQSLTKTDAQAYQELSKKEAPSYTTLDPPADNEYLEPM